MTVADAILAGFGILAIVLALGFGFIHGYSMRKLRELYTELKTDLEQRKAIEEQPDSAVVDSSPKHLREKREERIRKGEDPVDEEDSQIITTKPPGQLAAETNNAKEAKLDKWMPGVKRG